MSEMLIGRPKEARSLDNGLASGRITLIDPSKVDLNELVQSSAAGLFVAACATSSSGRRAVDPRSVCGFSLVLNCNETQSKSTLEG